MYSLLAFLPTALISAKQSWLEEESQGCFYFPLVKVLKEKGGYEPSSRTLPWGQTAMVRKPSSWIPVLPLINTIETFIFQCLIFRQSAFLPALSACRTLEICCCTVQAVNVLSQRLSFLFETIHHLLRRAEGYATDPHLLLAAIKCCNKLPF